MLNSLLILEWKFDHLYTPTYLAGLPSFPQVKHNVILLDRKFCRRLEQISLAEKYKQQCTHVKTSTSFFINKLREETRRYCPEPFGEENEILLTVQRARKSSVCHGGYVWWGVSCCVLPNTGGGSRCMTFVEESEEVPVFWDQVWLCSSGLPCASWTKGGPDFPSV